MATKNILLATADLQTVVDVNQALGAEWATIHVASEAEALAKLEEGSFDALLADFNLGQPDASEILNQAVEKCPKVTRFLFACEADLALVAAKVRGEHEILPKPIEVTSLKSRIEKGMSDPRTSEEGVATGFDTASSIPSVYSEVIQALESPEVSSQQVGAIIASDDTLTQEILTLTRSAYLGLPGRIMEPVDAVESLGLETVKALVMALRFLAEHSHVRPGYLSLERIWQHSIVVGQIARDLVLFETKDRMLASQALAAGLVHDLGKVVLATNFDDLYGRVHALARKQPVALWDIEKEMFGANHGEIGACLVGMWNLPTAVVDAVALHHEPPLGEQDHLTPLAAIHIANVLEHQLQPTEEFRVVPAVNTPFLNQLGLLHRLPVWRARFANQLSHTDSVEPAQMVSVAPVHQDAQASWTANELPNPEAPTQTATAAPADEKSRSTVPTWPRRWAYTGVAAGVLLLLALLLRPELDTEEPIPVHARAMDNPQATMVDASTSSIEAAPAFAPEVTPATVNPDEVSVVSTPSLPERATSHPAPNLAQTLDSQALVTAARFTNLPPEVTPAPSLRLNGIIYSMTRPSAMINGKTLFVGEEADGITVISIGRDKVTLEINGERKTIVVPGANGGF